jgi:hypothetical protein
MPTFSRRAVMAGTAVAVIGVAVPVTLAATTSSAQPADKAVAAGSHVQTVTPNGEVKILSATFKTSKPEDLLISVSAECSILTDVVIAGNPTPGAKDNQSASGDVRVYLTLDGKVVPITDTSAPPQDPSANGNGDKVKDSATFCDRVFRRTVGDSENPQNGIDSSEDYLSTKSANAFNWVRLNSGAGDHELDVWADFTTDATSNSNADAYIGNRTLIVEPTRLANNAVISDTGTN